MLHCCCYLVSSAVLVCPFGLVSCSGLLSYLRVGCELVLVFYLVLVPYLMQGLCVSLFWSFILFWSRVLLKGWACELVPVSYLVLVSYLI